MNKLTKKSHFGKIKTTINKVLKDSKNIDGNNTSNITNHMKDNKDDELYDTALQLVIDQRQASVSLLQRKMRIGYTRAARLIDSLEERGIVGPYEGSKAREVLIRKVKSL